MNKKNLENKRMIERYREMNKFKYSIFTITNPAIPTEAKNNPILVGIVLDKLKELKQEIEVDISNISIDMIDIEDILGKRALEVSELLTNEICLFDLETIKGQYKSYLKAKKLNSIFPVENRKSKVEELQKEINNLNLTIESLEEIDPSLVISQKEKVRKLEKEKEALEETFNFVSIEEIEGTLFARLHSYLNSILIDFNNKIAFIERNM
ncbi:hypothetical protein [uncultured Clostridium sp.]|uniref:hypothetical protein n=1 Tax=uncultured Clostridium sp. TaxID=59620 RepID=UPI0025CE4269|nr:hypothetical protein [uncultured Clostridium sp.]